MGMLSMLGFEATVERDEAARIRQVEEALGDARVMVPAAYAKEVNGEGLTLVPAVGKLYLWSFPVFLVNVNEGVDARERRRRFVLEFFRREGVQDLWDIDVVTAITPHEPTGAFYLLLPRPKRATNVEYDPPEERLEEPPEQEAVAMVAYRRIIGRFTQCTGLGVVIHIGRHETYSPYPEEAGYVHLHFHKCPPGDAQRRDLSELFGMPVTYLGNEITSLGHTRGRGHVLSDFKGTAVAQVLDANWYFLFPALTFFHGQVSCEIFIRALDLCWMVHHKPAAADALTPLGLETYVAARKEVAAFTKKHALKQITEIERTIARLNRDLDKAYSQLGLARETVAYGERQLTDDGSPLPPLEAEFQALSADKRISAVYLVAAGLQVKTVPLTIEHEGVRYLVGEFWIRLTDQGLLFVWCEKSLHPDRLAHPHIGEHDSPCYGSASHAIRTAAGERRVADTVRYVLSWLTDGYEPALARHPITEWPRAEAPRQEEGT